MMRKNYKKMAAIATLLSLVSALFITAIGCDNPTGGGGRNYRYSI